MFQKILLLGLIAILATGLFAQEIKIGRYQTDLDGQTGILTVFHTIPSFGKTFFAGYVNYGASNELVFGMLQRTFYQSHLSFQCYLPPTFSSKCQHFAGEWSHDEQSWIGEQWGENITGKKTAVVHGALSPYTPEARILETLLQSVSITGDGSLIAAEQQEPVLIDQCDNGWLVKWGGVKVLVLQGSHYQMGVAHGQLLKLEARQTIEAYLAFAAAQGMTQAKLIALYQQQEQYIPQAYKDEMNGLAHSSGLQLAQIQAAHAIPTAFHCSGAALWGTTSADLKAYHTRSLDYPLNIGGDNPIQQNGVVVVYRPSGGYAHVVIGWSGFCGCVTGMNTQGISLGEMTSKSKDENYAGMPMIFMLRHILEKASSLEQSTTIMKNGPRTCGYNFIVVDGKILKGLAVEVNRSKLKEFSTYQDNVEPHFALSSAIRRTNHFVDKELAESQREEYPPHSFYPKSWLLYQSISYFIAQNSGKFDPKLMVTLLKLYPAASACHHQAVFCPSDQRFWVSFARSPKQFGEKAGAQNFAFVPLDLKKIIQYQPPPPEK